MTDAVEIMLMVTSVNNDVVMLGANDVVELRLLLRKLRSVLTLLVRSLPKQLELLITLVNCIGRI